jgi:hypothetical protein
MSGIITFIALMLKTEDIKEIYSQKNISPVLNHGKTRHNLFGEDCKAFMQGYGIYLVHIFSLFKLLFSSV